MTDEDTSIRAKEIEREAVKTLNAFSFFGGKQRKYEDASELYSKAGAQWKIAKDWDNAGRCYHEAAKLAEKAGLEHEALTYFTNAAKAYKNSSPNEAVKLYNYITQKNMSANKFSNAAKLYKELAEMHEEAGNVREAMKAYTQAAECFKAEDSTTSANQMRLKVADHAAEQKDYKQAIEILESVSAASVDNNLTRWSVKEYLFKAGICQLALASQNGRISQVADAIERYIAMNPACEGTREFKLLQGLMKALESNDSEAFSDLLFEFHQIQKLDSWKSNILMDIKNAIKARSESEALRSFNGGAGGDADELKKMNEGDVSEFM